MNNIEVKSWTMQLSRDLLIHKEVDHYDGMISASGTIVGYNRGKVKPKYATIRLKNNSTGHQFVCDAYLFNTKRKFWQWWRGKFSADFHGTVIDSFRDGHI